jgi:hypothetical protein
MDEGTQILELARNAQQLFERQKPRQKRRLLNFVLSNCTWEDGEVVATFREPFDLLAETTAIAARSAVSEIPNLTKSEIWLPGDPSQQRRAFRAPSLSALHGRFDPSTDPVLVLPLRLCEGRRPASILGKPSSLREAPPGSQKLNSR